MVSGSVRMTGRTDDDIVVIEPGETTDFCAPTDTVTTVVKIPRAPDDKYVA